MRVELSEKDIVIVLQSLEFQLDHLFPTSIRRKRTENIITLLKEKVARTKEKEVK